MKITLVSTLKNEAPYLLEWLAHHRAAGVNHFTIFSNDCTDGTNLLLDRLAQAGLIEHFNNPLGPRMDPQRAAYSRARRMQETWNSDWIIALDGDEFLNIHCGDRTVHALLDTCPPCDAVSLNWRIMGSGGIGRAEPGPVTNRFCRGANLEHPENGLVWGFKTLFRPTAFDYIGVHRPKFHRTRTV
ncbi:MAG: glycosyltransferase family 2 protein, partial [Pseudomonadota bacterium]